MKSQGVSFGLAFYLSVLEQEKLVIKPLEHVRSRVKGWTKRQLSQYIHDDTDNKKMNNLTLHASASERFRFLAFRFVWTWVSLGEAKKAKG